MYQPKSTFKIKSLQLKDLWIHREYPNWIEKILIFFGFLSIENPMIVDFCLIIEHDSRKLAKLIKEDDYLISSNGLAFIVVKRIDSKRLLLKYRDNVDFKDATDDQIKATINAVQRSEIALEQFSLGFKVLSGRNRLVKEQSQNKTATLTTSNDNEVHTGY